LQRCYDILDNVLTGVLLVLVVAMVFSISAEIVLNAGVWPVANKLIELAAGPDAGEAAAVAAKATDVGEESRTLRALESVKGFVNRASAPINTASQTLLVWIGILGSALAFRLRAHLGVDALVRLYPYRARLFLDYLMTALVGAFSLVVLVIGGYKVAQLAFSRGDLMPGIESVNRGWFYLVLVIAGVLNLIYCIYHFANPKPVETAEAAAGEAENP
jgi:TRAP-type C4-dicarboxylate transport system permease small subunit